MRSVNRAEPLEPTLLTVTEVATLMRVSRMTVYRLAHNGQLQSVRIGRVLRITKTSVRAFLGDAFGQ